MKGRRVKMRRMRVGRGVRGDVGQGGQGGGEVERRDEGNWRWLNESEVETKGRWREQDRGSKGSGIRKERTNHTRKEGGNNPKGWSTPSKTDGDEERVKGWEEVTEGRLGSETEGGDEDQSGQSGKEGRKERRAWEGVQWRGVWFHQ